jgi:hypothetical protein
MKRGTAISSLVFGIAAVAVAVAQGTAPGPEGTWRGTLQTGASTLRLVLKIAKAPDGLFTGSLDSLDQGSTIPIDRITVTGATVRLELKAVSGVFEGTMNVTGTELRGTWNQGMPLPLTFTRDTGGAPASAMPPAPVTAAAFPLGLPVELGVPMPPTPFMGHDGRSYLAYEVHLTNFSGRDLTLARLEVLSGASVIATFADTALNAMLALSGSSGAIDRRTMPAGRRAVAFLWLPIAGAPPPTLRHRVTIGELSVEGASIDVLTSAPILIGPPLAGDGWLAANGPGPASGHRRALITIDGHARIAQRFAIDWVRLNPDGRTFAGDQKDNKSYRAYGAEALAVADATVAATKDGIVENVPGPTSRAVPITIDTIGGNHVVLDLGGGRFAFYAHLQPGSLRVKVGDRVARGQVIGLVGNSGNSTEPHLHFHVSDGVSPLGSDGVPYAIAGMTGMPLQNARVAFPR